MYAMNMESLVGVLVFGVVVGWAMDPRAHLMMCVEKLTGSLVLDLRGMVALSHCETAPSYSAVRSRRNRDDRRTVFARGRPLGNPLSSGDPMALPG